MTGHAAGERRPDVALCVVNATHLRRHLRLVLAVQRLGLPVVVVLNMIDYCPAAGLRVDAEALSRELGVPVIATVATKGQGWMHCAPRWTSLGCGAFGPRRGCCAGPGRSPEDRHDAERVHDLLDRLGMAAEHPAQLEDRVDAMLLHRVAGPLLLAALLFLMFQAVFAWAQRPWTPSRRRPSGWARPGQLLAGSALDGWPRSLLVDGVIAGAGGVVVFLPQIVILFFFILVLEESGYLPRAAFCWTASWAAWGLSGRSFIPLLSSLPAPSRASWPRARLPTRATDASRC